eukprot:gene6102-21352_t
MCWVNFAASGDPNKPVPPPVPWPRHANATGTALEIGDTMQAIGALKKA